MDLSAVCNLLGKLPSAKYSENDPILPEIESRTGHTGEVVAKISEFSAFAYTVTDESDSTSIDCIERFNEELTEGDSRQIAK